MKKLFEIIMIFGMASIIKIYGAIDRNLTIETETVDLKSKKWNFIRISDDTSGPLYRIYGDSLITEFWNGDRQWYSMHGDSVLYLGNETRFHKVNAQKSLATSAFGNMWLAVNDTTDALGHYYHTLGMSQDMAYTCSLPISGEIILNDEYTLPAVAITETRVITPHISCDSFPDIELTTKKIVRTRWFVEGDFLPVAMQTSESEIIRNKELYTNTHTFIFPFDDNGIDEGRYDYTYDNNDRLIAAGYSASGSVKDFSTTYSYDDRGNMTSLTRKGIIDKAGDSEIFGLLDNLSMGYSGNQLKSVNATTEALPFDGITGVGQNISDMSISYDASGRICADETRGIYNNDGYPVRIVFENGNEQHDKWDGLGNHLATEYYSPRALGGNRPFAIKRYGGTGQIEYQVEISGGTQRKILAYTSFPGGYFDQNGIPHYYITDYQGNNILTVNSVPEITSENNYYPYGEPWREKNGLQFMFSGNERLSIDGLNEYDFHARRYRSAIPAFSSWDLHNEKYPWLSPYTMPQPIQLIS